MAYEITEDCISCGACETECPNKAISQGADRFQIDPAKCNECAGNPKGSRCAAVCPVGAPQKKK